MQGIYTLNPQLILIENQDISHSYIHGKGELTL